MSLSPVNKNLYASGTCIIVAQSNIWHSSCIGRYSVDISHLCVDSYNIILPIFLNQSFPCMVTTLSQSVRMFSKHFVQSLKKQLLMMLSIPCNGLSSTQMSIHVKLCTSQIQYYYVYPQALCFLLNFNKVMP